MITIIFGTPGAGKTALMTSFAVQRMTNELAANDVTACKKEVKTLNKGGFNLLLPRLKHLVFSDYYIGGRVMFSPKIESYYCNGYHIGLPNEDVPVDFYPPFSQFYLDEAQKYFNSRRFNKFPSWVSRFYEMHRHNGHNFTMTCQRLGLIDLNIREIAELFLYVEAMQQYYKDGRLVRTCWRCRQFFNNIEAEEFMATRKGGKRAVYYFEENIFEFYDSKGQRAGIFDNRYDEDFTLINNVKLEENRNSYVTFNSMYDYSVPEGFYNGAKNLKEK